VTLARSKRWLVILSLAWWSACAGQGATPPPSAPLAWQSPLDRDNPLVGRIYDVAHGRFVGEHELLVRARAAHFVAIGEQHDNADHHLLQARVLHAIVAAGRLPALVFEMLERGQQPAVDRALREHPGDADALAQAVDWEHSGWPAWPLYRPLFVELMRAQLPIVAAGIDRAAAMRIATEGTAALDPELVREGALDQPLAPELQSALREEMRDVHCGALPESMLDGMALIQRARDTQLAHGMRAAGASGALLIAGAGHVRNDRGVPAYLARAGAGTALSIGLLEAQPGRTEPGQYAAGYARAALPFDLVWFTPRASDEDHCAELRARHAPGS
jgi:uncharacterized iron-regulated protein